MGLYATKDIYKLPQKKSEPVPSSLGFVYFVATADKQSVKIGCAKNITKRLKDLQTGNQQLLIVLAEIPTEKMLRLERELHERFKKDRVRAEWFTMSKDIVELIDQLNRKDPQRTQQKTYFQGQDFFSTNLFDKRIAPQ